jgi:hypothetical protein
MSEQGPDLRPDGASERVDVYPHLTDAENTQVRRFLLKFRLLKIVYAAAGTFVFLFLIGLFHPTHIFAKYLCGSVFLAGALAFLIRNQSANERLLKGLLASTQYAKRNGFGADEIRLTPRSG